MRRKANAPWIDAPICTPCRPFPPLVRRRPGPSSPLTVEFFASLRIGFFGQIIHKSLNVLCCPFRAVTPRWVARGGRPLVWEELPAWFHGSSGKSSEKRIIFRDRNIERLFSLLTEAPRDLRYYRRLTDITGITGTTGIAGVLFCCGV